MSSEMTVLPLERLVRLRSQCSSGEAHALRVAADVRLDELCGEVGVSAKTLWRWERGIGTPRGEAAARYADVLDRLAAVVPS